MSRPPLPQRVPPDASRGSLGRHAGATDAPATRPAWADRGGPGPPAPPSQPPPLGHAPREAKPRQALNAASGLASGGSDRLFLTVSTAIVPARLMTRRANAHMASVTGRYSPVQVRTSDGSRPTSPCAASTLLSRVQRLPATRATSASVVGGGANLTDAVRSSRALRRRRTRHQRRQGGHGIGPRHPAPVIPPRAFRPVAGPEPGPPLHRYAGQERLHLARRRAEPPRCLARDRQDIGLWVGLQPPPPRAMMPVHAVPGAPCGRPASCPGVGPHPLGQRRRGRHAPVLRQAGLPTALPRVRPWLRPIACPILPHRAPSGRASLSKTPIGPLSTLPAVPRYWRTTPAECGPEPPRRLEGHAGLPSRR
jgi:hypothetical protein